MPRSAEPKDSVLQAWRTNCRATEFLLEGLPADLWPMAIPGAPRRTFRSVGVHLHNATARWVRTLGQEHGIAAPARVDPHRATLRQVLVARRLSARGIEQVLALGVASGGRIPPSRGYTWRNLPLDVGHVLAYFVAHDAHHRGQIILAARALGHRLPSAVTDGVWQWSAFARERGRVRRP
jgi:uncharacterized damage-inducible protein DinB